MKKSGAQLVVGVNSRRGDARHAEDRRATFSMFPSFSGRQREAMHCEPTTKRECEGQLFSQNLDADMNLESVQTNDGEMQIDAKTVTKPLGARGNK